MVVTGRVCQHLQIISSRDIESSPVLSSSGRTVAWPSPFTPKPTFHNALSQVQFPPTVYLTPRGRRREAISSQGTRHLMNSSPTRSRSGTKPLILEESPRLVARSFRSCTDLKGSTEKLVDGSSVSGFPQSLSHAAPKQFSSLKDVYRRGRPDGGVVKNRQEDFRSRARVEDFSRDAHSTDAPGFG